MSQIAIFYDKEEVEAQPIRPANVLLVIAQEIAIATTAGGVLDFPMFLQVIIYCALILKWIHHVSVKDFQKVT